MEHTKAAGTSAVKASENDGELYRARPHLLALIAPCVLLAATIILAYVAHRHVPGLGVRLGLRAETTGAFDAACRWFLVIVPGIIGLNVIATAITHGTTTYVVTGDRVIATSGLLRVTGSTTYLAKVESVVRDQGPLERLCDAGTITLVTAGGYRDTLTNVRKFSRCVAALEGALSRRGA